MNAFYTMSEEELRKLGEIIPLRHMKDLMSDDRVFYQLHTGYKEKALPFFKHVPYKVMIEITQEYSEKNKRLVEALKQCLDVIGRLPSDKTKRGRLAQKCYDDNIQLLTELKAQP